MVALLSNKDQKSRSEMLPRKRRLGNVAPNMIFVSVCLLELFFGKTRIANVTTDVITFLDKGTFYRKNVLQELLSMSDYHDH